MFDHFKLILFITILGICAAQGTYTRQNQSCSSTTIWNGQQCALCSTNCTCTTAGTCGTIQCSQGYAAQNGRCVQCPYGCSTCQSSMSYASFQCLSCISGYQLINGICIQLQTQVTIETQPFQVYDQGYLNQYSTIKCAQMNPNNSLCLQCPSESYLSEYNTCQSCVTGCISCQASGTCDQCGISSNWNPVLQICSPCTDTYALTCSTSGTSVTCKSGYYLSTTTSKCAPCSTSCTSCTNSLTCTTCATGFYLQNNYCYPCNQYCQTCTSTKCLTCATNILLLSNNTCLNCTDNIPGCAVCAQSSSGAISCDTCQNGFYKNSNSTCTACSTISSSAYFCYQYDYSSNSQIIVTQCTQGSVLVSNTTCVSNNNYCLTAFSNSSCDSCYPNYYLQNGKCVQCSSISNCSTCTNTSSGLICNSCQTNYVLNSLSNTCNQCPLNCTSCQPNFTCTTCLNGYQLNSGKCTLCNISECQTCTISECDACMPGYFLINTQSGIKCLGCPSGCATCDLGNSCTSCFSGYYLQNNGCNAGNQYCSTYNNNGTCFNCTYGFRLYNGSCYGQIDFIGGYVYGVNAGDICSTNPAPVPNVDPIIPTGENIIFYRLIQITLLLVASQLV